MSCAAKFSALNRKGTAMDTAKRKGKRAEFFVQILRNEGVSVDGDTSILDLGCGAGIMVKAARAKGYQFHGCGIGLRDAHDSADPELMQQGVLREIKLNPYTLPFDDRTFDVVISDQVFEHVMDYPTTLREIHRVLKPGGAFLHIFPARYMPIEPHVLVPFAAVLRARWWLKSWALFGIRNEFQKRMSASEACMANLTYLNTRTNYLTKRELRRQFSQGYTDVRFVESAFLKNSERGRKVYELSRWLPFLPKLYSAMGNRAAFGRRDTASTAGNS
jgi:ubiquinone/menaquinone biosynthesis C-methylase UbiE